MIIHSIEPIYNKKSKILILGSFPSVKSRETQFFYGHPQNRFWKVVSTVFGEVTPQTMAEKRKFLLRNGVAVWDVICIPSTSPANASWDLEKLIEEWKIIKD